MRGALCLLLVAGCDGVFNLHELKPADATVGDGTCAWSQLFDTCSFGDPALWQPDVQVEGAVDGNAFTTFRTVTIDGIDIKVVLVQKLSVLTGGTLVVTGNKPIAIVSSGDIAIDGTIRPVGSGRTAGECGKSAGATGVPGSGGAGGGGGGGYGAAGGAGGNGDSDGGATRLGGIGGVPDPMPARLVGGCPGADGGLAVVNAMTISGGKGGDGGGAIALVSRTSVAVGANGVVIAAGRGGRGGAGSTSYSTGGGGGGAGGMIYLEAPQLAIAGALAANGGGGGEGGASSAGNDGSDGTVGDVAAMPGAGAANNGGDGGSGGSLSHPDGFPSTQFLQAGGGGGGGGVGRIVLVGASPNITGSVSPSPAPPP